MRIKYSSEILKIIEAGMEEDREKVKASAELLMKKIPVGDMMRQAIKKRIEKYDGDEKNAEKSCR